jgi:hypothetical protein
VPCELLCEEESPRLSTPDGQHSSAGSAEDHTAENIHYEVEFSLSMLRLMKTDETQVSVSS